MQRVRSVIKRGFKREKGETNGEIKDVGTSVSDGETKRIGNTLDDKGGKRIGQDRRALRASDKLEKLFLLLDRHRVHKTPKPNDLRRKRRIAIGVSTNSSEGIEINHFVAADDEFEFFGL